MPLRKLWNSIRGKSATPKVHASSETVSPGTGRPESGLNPEPPTQPAQQTSPPPQRPATVPARPATPKSISGAATRDDKKLFRRMDSLSVQSVLEVGVGDGRRSLAMLHALTHKGHSTPIHYIAIDEFELGGNALSLRDFHKQLREYPAKAHLVPMAIDAGLDRVVRRPAADPGTTQRAGPLEQVTHHRVRPRKRSLDRNAARSGCRQTGRLIDPSRSNRHLRRDRRDFWDRQRLCFELGLFMPETATKLIPPGQGRPG